MDVLKKQEIANSFPEKYAESALDIMLSKEEYVIFQIGIYAGSMDEKWDAFSLNDTIFFARSWTGNCIFKIFVTVSDDVVRLEKLQVNRDEEQYKGTDTVADTILLKKLLQMYLKRDDFYIDPRLDLQLIKQTIQNQDPDKSCTKSIGSATVELTIRINKTLTTPPNDDFFAVIGWQELEARLFKRSLDESLITVYIQHKENGQAKTLYFDQNGNEFLGEIVIKKKDNNWLDSLFSQCS